MASLSALTVRFETSVERQSAEQGPEMGRAGGGVWMDPFFKDIKPLLQLTATLFASRL